MHSLLPGTQAASLSPCLHARMTHGCSPHLHHSNAILPVSLNLGGQSPSAQWQCRVLHLHECVQKTPLVWGSQVSWNIVPQELPFLLRSSRCEPSGFNTKVLGRPLECRRLVLALCCKLGSCKSACYSICLASSLFQRCPSPCLSIPLYV